MNARSHLVLLVSVFAVSCSGDLRIVGDVSSAGSSSSAGATSSGGATATQTYSQGGDTDVVGGALGTGGTAASSVGASSAFGGQISSGGSAALGGTTSAPVCPNSVGPGLAGQSCPSAGYVCEFAGSPCGGFMHCDGGLWRQETVCPSGTGGASSGGQPTLGGTTSTTSNAGTGGVDCGCVRGAYVPVCGSNGTTYDAACGDTCVPVSIACRHQCPCTSSTGGATSNGGTGSTGGTSTTITSYGGLCNSGCTLQGAVSGVCKTNLELVVCTTRPYNPDIYTIMPTNGCTVAGIDSVGFCCPATIETQCQ